MVYLLFAVSVIVTVVVAIKLSKYADIISNKSKADGAFLGAVLLGGATSLPEITTSYTAAFINNPNMILGNILGSNLFNFLTLAFLNVYFLKRRIFQHATKEHVFASKLGLVLTVYLLFSLYIKANFQLLHVGLDSFLLIAGCAMGMWLLSRIQIPENHKEIDAIKGKNKKNYESIPMNRTILYFFLSCFIILVFGTVLTVTGDSIAIITGLGSSFVGMFMIAVTTSLPEVVSGLVAVRLGNPGLAIGSVLGSNIINLFILGSSDIFYRHGLLLSSVEIFHYISTIILVVMYGMIIFVLQNSKKRAAGYLNVSIIIFVLYFLNSIYLYMHL